MMTAYFDESGTHGAESPMVTVAGFIANPEQWSAYQHDLLALNEEYGVKLFHAKDIRGRKGSFKNWTTRKRAEYNSRFLQLADDHLTCGLSMLVSSDEYRNTYRSTIFPRKARPDTSYGICVRAALLKSITLLKDRREDWPLNVVMESGHKNVGDAIKVLTKLRQDFSQATWTHSAIFPSDRRRTAFH